jgi:uncharacterized protein (UPF0210 family)
MPIVIRTITAFAESSSASSVDTAIDAIEKVLARVTGEGNGVTVQTARVVVPPGSPPLAADVLGRTLSVTDLPLLWHAPGQMSVIPGVSTSVRGDELNMEEAEEVEELLRVWLPQETTDPGAAAAACFASCIVFGAPDAVPFFPSTVGSKVVPAVALGLQTASLLTGTAVEGWADQVRSACDQLLPLVESALADTGIPFLGFDTSSAPMGDDHGSFGALVDGQPGPLAHTVTSSFFTQTSRLLRSPAANPRPVGLCGLMFPVCEDSAIARWYEQGDFSVERNLFLSLHSGLGIDTYPIGVDESPARVRQILALVQALAAKHAKCLAVRFVTDGRARIGDRTSFGHPYLTDVTVRPL